MSEDSFINYYSPEDEIPHIKDFDLMLAWWQRLRGDGFLPRKSDIKFKDMAGWHSRLILSKVDHDGYDLEFRIIGEEVHGYYGPNVFAGRRYSEIPGVSVDVRFNHMKKCIKESAVSHYYGPLQISKREHIIISAVGLPFADDGGKLSHILSLYLSS